MKLIKKNELKKEKKKTIESDKSCKPRVISKICNPLNRRLGLIKKPNLMSNDEIRKIINFKKIIEANK
jgi:hypothetical protein